MNPEPFLILFSSYSRECEPDLRKALAKRTTSRHKFNAWVYLRFRLARTCVHLRWLTDDDLCSLWSRSNLHASPRRFFTVWPPNQVELSPFVISFAWWLHFGQAGLPGLKRPYSLVINKNRGRPEGCNLPTSSTNLSGQPPTIKILAKILDWLYHHTWRSPSLVKTCWTYKNPEFPQVCFLPVH